MSTTFAAHVVTVEATALGDPEILIMAPDEGFGAVLVETIAVPADITLAGALDLAEERGYRFPTHPTQVQPGYWVIDAVKY